MAAEESSSSDLLACHLPPPPMPEVTSLLEWLEMWPRGNEPRLREALVERLAAMLGVDFVFVGHLTGTEPAMIRTATWLQEGVIQENIKYLLAGTPCERVIAGGELCVPRGVAEQFPDDTFLSQHSITAYAGVPLSDDSGQRIGVFGVMSRRPLSDTTAVCQLLHFCADRLSPLRQAKQQPRSVATAGSLPFAPLSRARDLLESVPAAFVVAAVTQEEITLVDVVDAAGILALLAGSAAEPAQRLLEVLGEYRRARTAQDLFSGTEVALELPAVNGTWIQSRWKQHGRSAGAGSVVQWSGILLPASVQSGRNDAGLEQETLLRETHHRIKNNLQIVASLLRMQAVGSSDPAVRMALGDAMLRVSAIAAVHAQLQSKSLMTPVDLRRFLTSLIENVQRTLAPPDSNIALSVEVGELELSLESATACGLIINELVTNSFRYAFTGTGAHKLSVRVCLDGPRVTMTVEDDGPGLPLSLRHGAAKGLGLKLIRSLAVQQLRGTCEIGGPPGLRTRVTFPLRRGSP